MLTTVLLVATIHWTFVKAPIEARMGVVQKIFYFHVPSAYAMYIGAGACFLGSVMYLLKPDGRTRCARSRGRRGGHRLRCDRAHHRSALGREVVGLFLDVDPQLTTTVLSWLIYVAYIVLRSYSGDGPV